MFGIDINILAFAGLAALSAAGVAYVFLFSRVENENKRDQRFKNMQSSNIKAANKAVSSREINKSKRRKSVQDTMKVLEDKQKNDKKKPSLKQLIFQAGLKTSVPKFYGISALSGVIFLFLGLVFAGSLYVSLAAFVVGFLGFPRFILGYIRKKRIKSFTTEFPNAVDVIVRGVRAGLPLNDCIAIVGRESKDPVASEFRRIIEHQNLGMPLSDAVLKLNESMPTAEANFFGIVIAIQQGAGGNLAEALANLSGVLRDRKMMEAKIKAMSAEAKASGGIIGSLPIIVGFLVYLTTPDYIKVLFTEPAGNIILAGSAIWMSMGIMVMKKMINFDF
ncbi:MAG: type II secretion system F family protein [Rhizobiaceae bacterium]|nr:type II secretion system F family protein [Rhizobiaceae bacterium]